MTPFESQSPIRSTCSPVTLHSLNICPNPAAALFANYCPQCLPGCPDDEVAEAQDYVTMTPVHAI